MKIVGSAQDPTFASPNEFSKKSKENKGQAMRIPFDIHSLGDSLSLHPLPSHITATFSHEHALLLFHMNMHIA